MSAVVMSPLASADAACVGTKLLVVGFGDLLGSQSRVLGGRGAAHFPQSTSVPARSTACTASSGVGV